MGSLFDRCENLLGPLPADLRKLVVDYLNAPSEAGWDRIHGVVIVPSLRRGTLWQAVLAIDPTFPNVGPSYSARGRRLSTWKRYPDALLLARAIRAATSTSSVQVGGKHG